MLDSDLDVEGEDCCAVVPDVPDRRRRRRAARAPRPGAVTAAGDHGADGRAGRLGRDPGDVLVSLGLGSCIGVALVDRAPRRRRARPRDAARVAGRGATTPGHFADTAVPALLAQIERARRARPRAGGGARGRRADVRARRRRRSTSARATRPPCASALAALRLPVVAAETGGSRGRTIRVDVDDRPRHRPRGGRHEDELFAGAPRATEVARMSGRVLSNDADRRARRGGAARAALPEEPRNEPRRSARCARSTSRARRSSRPTRSGASSARSTPSAARPSTRLSAELRMPLELEVINITQLTWSQRARAGARRTRSAAIARRHADRHAHAADAPSCGLVLQRDRAAARRRRDRRAARAPADRDRLGARPRTSSSACSRSSRPSGGPRRARARARSARDAHGHRAAGRRCPSRRWRSRSRRASTAPRRRSRCWCRGRAIAPVADALRRPRRRVRARRRRRRSRRRAPRRRRRRRRLRAEVAAIEMPIEEVLALRPGDVVRLGAPRRGRRRRSSPTSVPVHRAQPGRSGPRRAVQVVERVGRSAHEQADDALLELGSPPREAVSGVLEMFAPARSSSATSTVVAGRRPSRSTASRAPGRGDERLLRRRRHRRQRVRR